MEVLVLAGPSGSGKSKLAIDFALELKQQGIAAEILCADSVTIYKGFDIGSAKPSLKDQQTIPHHLIDLVTPNHDFTAANFVEAADPILKQCLSQKKLPILVGGTGFYLRALLQGMTEQESNLKNTAEKTSLNARAKDEGIENLYEEMVERDPDLKLTIHRNDQYRIIRALQAMNTTGRLWSELNKEAKAKAPRYKNVRFFCCELPREELLVRITERSQVMLQEGLVDEVQKLLLHYPPETKALQSVGYRECLAYLGVFPDDNKPRPKNLEELSSAITQSTMQLAKRQMTWFRGEKNVEFLRCAKAENFLSALKTACSV